MRRIGTVRLPRSPFLGDALNGASRLGVSVPLVATCFALVALVAITVALQTTYADRVPAGVQALGIDLGGRSRVEARGLLQAELAAQLRQPVTLRVQGREWQLTARELGLNGDADLLADRAFQVGRDGNPVQRAAAHWGALVFGERVREAGTDLDKQRVETVLSSIAREVDRPAQEARLSIVRSGDGPQVALSPEEAGLRLVASASTDRIREAISRGLPTAVDLVTEIEPPGTTAADLQPAKAQAERMLSAPLVVALEGRRWTIGRDEIARMIIFERNARDVIQASLNVDALADRWDRISREVGKPAVDARFEWARGDLRVIREGEEGRGVDLEAMKPQIRERLLSEDRTLPLSLTVSQPAITSGDGPKLGIRELIKEGRTSFAGGVAEKQHNIRLAASRLHGTVVAPGATFSFNREVGPTTLDAGFKTGWGITLSSAGARTIPSVAGGICQVATTLFQPVFHAGYAIEERNWHLYWIQSYGQPPLGMKGLDATVDEDYGVDFKFVNTTSDFVLIQARVDGTTLIFGLYGTKPSWDVKVEGPVIANVVPADRTVVHRSEPTMPAGRTLQVESAQDGFDVTVTRTVTLGDDVRTLNLRSHYLPSQNVVLYGPGAAPTPTPLPTPGTEAVPAHVGAPLGGPTAPTPSPTTGAAR